MIIPRWRLVVPLAALFAVSALLWWATAVWPLLPFGSAVFYRWSWVWTFAILLALFGLPVTLLAALFRRARRNAVRLSAGFAAILIGFGVGARVGGSQRLKRLEGIPARAAPLIAAIQTFEEDHQRPPNRLEELLPDYIATIPSTGFGGHPAWSYQTAPFANHADYSGLYGENAWALNLYVAGRPVPSYRMLYLPNARYPSTAGRVGEWARMEY